MFLLLFIFHSFWIIKIKSEEQVRAIREQAETQLHEGQKW